MLEVLPDPGASLVTDRSKLGRYTYRECLRY